MNVKQPGMEKNRSIEDLHDLRLKTLLGDLVRATMRQAGQRRTWRGPPDFDGQPGERKAEPADAGGAGPGTAGRGMAAQLIFVNFMRKILNNFPRGAWRGYATALECATIKPLSGFSSVSRLRNLGAPSL